LKITVAIPTKDRKNKVGRLLNTLSEQSIKSFKVLIADASVESVSYDTMFPNLDVDIIRVSRGNLPRQRRISADCYKGLWVLLLYSANPIKHIGKTKDTLC
jgi:hypothetical protein